MAKNQHPRRANREKVSRIAFKTRNEIFVTPKADEIQIDIDGYRAAQEFNRRVRLFLRFVDVRGWTMRLERSRSRKPFHFHVTIRARGWRMGSHCDTRVLLASLLGSDATREIINYARVTERKPYPICFFRPKTVSGKRAKFQRFGPIARA